MKARGGRGKIVLISSVQPRMPWGRLDTVDDVGNAAAFLASDDADYITVTSLLVDGGYLLLPPPPVE